MEQTKTIVTKLTKLIASEVEEKTGLHMQCWLEPRIKAALDEAYHEGYLSAVEIEGRI